MEYWDVDSVTSRYKAWNLRFMEHRQGMFEEQVGDGEGRVTSSSLILLFPVPPGSSASPDISISKIFIKSTPFVSSLMPSPPLAWLPAVTS